MPEIHIAEGKAIGHCAQCWLGEGVRVPFVAIDAAPLSTAPGDEAGVCATCGGSGRHGTKSHGYGEEPMKCHDCAGTGRLMDSGPPDHWGATCAVCGGSGRCVIAIDEPSCACETCGGTGRAASGGGR